MRASRWLAWALVLAAGCAHPPSSLPTGRVGGLFLTLDGETRTLASTRGKVVLLTVITTWSGPALVEAAFLKELQRDYAPDFQVICVALDEDPDMLRIFEDSFGLNYPLVRPHNPARFTGDQGPLGKITMVPTSALINRDGQIEARMDGLWDPNVLRDAVRLLVERGAEGSDR
jgi:thiol-disulfide isomerase/thioredoxin